MIRVLNGSNEKLMKSCWKIDSEQKSPHVRESKTFLNSGFHAVDSIIQYSLSVEHGFRISIVSGIRHGFFELYSRFQSSGFQSSGFQIPQEKLPDSGIQEQKCPGLITESEFPYTGRKTFYACNQQNIRVFFTFGSTFDEQDICCVSCWFLCYNNRRCVRSVL